jgi:catechol 2,3-dioxygenase-like lactoylglutathione lyase family enzyme
VITIRRIDHVGLGVADLEDATQRWALQFGLTVRERSAQRAWLCCDDEPCAVELLADAPPGFHHVAYELAADCPVEQAQAHLSAFGAPVRLDAGRLHTVDADGNAIVLLPYREPVSRRVAHARPAGVATAGHPRRLAHVNFLTAGLQGQLQFYTEGLGMKLTDWLGDSGAWVHIGSDHHVMALIDQGYAHFHHLAFELVDIGHMRDLLDHLGRHGRWLGWGPARHGVGGNIASYVRIVEEECFVELYCDMEQLQPDHQPRHWPDDRYSSNTWGPLPPRSYFRFDQAAIDSERESLEALGIPLPDPEVPAAG